MMNKPSFLLCLDGSNQSQMAAELAFDMANKADAQITAQHVVDTITTWHLLRNEEPGFIGSGLYVESFEILKKALLGIAYKLMEKYDSVAESRKIDSISVIDEGDPVDQICRRSLKHDLVVVGHRSHSKANSGQTRLHNLRYNIAEGLADKCSKPLLIVQKPELPFWQDMKILVSLDHMNISFIRACLRTAVFFDITPTLICLMSGYHEEKTKDLLKNLHETHPDLSEIKIETKVVRKATDTDQSHIEIWTEEPTKIEFDLSQFKKSLLIVPTRFIGGKRISILGVEAHEIVAQLSIESILLWPEENLMARTDEDAEKIQVEQLTV